MIDGTKLREQVITSILHSKVEQVSDPGYKLSPVASEPTIMSLCFAVLAAELFNSLPGEEVEKWERALTGVQDSQTGLFIDPFLSSEDLDPTGPGEEYSVYQTTYFVLNALMASRRRRQ